ncbi:ATP-grasp domain-containing protein [Actinoallomurus sp. NPDC052308]|uniref:ATP-grasp domain-containing protein n=1 Tax=Actinoallomurus sp. NPDC052308 TaxID=3155530 RepID=UPI00343C6E76
MATLVIGCGVKLISSLQEQMPGETMVVVEHPQVIEQRGLREKAKSLPTVEALVPCDYIGPFEPRALIDSLPAGTVIERVLPAIDEMTTEASARIAAELGLPGAGVHAAEIFRDKLRLREVAHAAGIPNPRWREVHDLAGLERAARELAGDGLVLKPTGRSGSQGVVLLDPGDDLAEAWRHTTTAEGRVRIDPPPFTGYLVEERLHGSEVSVECLVAGGKVVFGSVTDKRVLPGRHPVEIGHVVPAPVGAAVRKDLLDGIQTLVDASGYEFGILHCEWMVTAAGPVLIECAGRLAGDRITDLVRIAYDFPLLGAYASLMGRDGPVGAIPATPVRAAAVKFLTATPGVLDGVTGLDEATAAPGVRAATVTAAPGDRVAAPRASRDRIGHVMAVGDDAGQAWERVESAARLIRVTVR